MSASAGEPGTATGWPAGAPRDLPAIVTGIPGTAGHNAKDPDFGFASPDEAGRQRALDWARGEAAAVARMVGEGHRIRAVQLHSAPTGKADADAFAQSLLEMAGWDWGGAALWIEHCDAWVEGQEPNKGYLTLDQELAVLDADDRPVPPGTTALHALASRARDVSTASCPRKPEPRKIASSSASDSAPAPRARSFSRGRSSAGQSRMCIGQGWRASCPDGIRQAKCIG